jgi:DNA-binding GntR family transcriptional regulator
MIAAIEARDIEGADRLGKAHAEQIVLQVQRLFSRNERLDIAL